MRDAKTNTDGLTVTMGPEWNNFRKNRVDEMLNPWHMGTIVGSQDASNRVYVSWDGMKQGLNDLDFYILGREVVIAERKPKFSEGDVVTIRGHYGKWEVLETDANHVHVTHRDRHVLAWFPNSAVLKKHGVIIRSKPEDMQKVECVEQVPTKPDSSPQIVPGSVVRLRSGGPDMTVEEIDTDTKLIPWCVCYWFNEAEFCNQAFSVHSLEFVR